MSATQNITLRATNGAAPPPPDALPFDPTLPYAVPLPWPGQWGACSVVYDLYKCEQYQDAEPTYMAEDKAAARQVDARLRAANAIPDDAAHAEERAAAWDAWQAAYKPWRRANCLRQLAYFGVALRLPDGTLLPAAAPATWAAFPLKFLEWIVDDGYALARAELWDPKSATPSITPSPSGPDPLP